MSLTLDLLYSFDKDGVFKAAKETTVAGEEEVIVWGTYAYFKIQSTPADYNLELMKIVITTETGTAEFGDIFISSFI